MNNTFVFDIETIPDLDAGRRIYGLEDLSDEDTAKAMFHIRAQESFGTSGVIGRLRPCPDCSCRYGSAHPRARSHGAAPSRTAN